MRENRWVIAELRGKGGRIRTVAVPVWVKNGINTWQTAAGIEEGPLFRSIRKVGRSDVLRVAAFQGQRGIQQFLENGLNTTQRRVLSELGLMHEALLAKLQLLWDCLRDGSVSPILKTLNSILGSLSEFFAPLHAVKEFKEMMEVAIERLGPDSDPIVVRLGDLPELE